MRFVSLSLLLSSLLQNGARDETLWELLSGQKVSPGCTNRKKKGWDLFPKPCVLSPNAPGFAIAPLVAGGHEMQQLQSMLCPCRSKFLTACSIKFLQFLILHDMLITHLEYMHLEGESAKRKGERLGQSSKEHLQLLDFNCTKRVVAGSIHFWLRETKAGSSLTTIPT